MNLIILLIALFSAPQDSLKLTQCYEKAYEKYPNAYQKVLYQSSSELKLKNLGVNLLPQISLKGQASYQSDVPVLNVNIPHFIPPDMSKDRYQLTLDVRQTIYDGGTVSSLKDAEEKQLLADKQRVEVELYALKQRVNDLFFSVLLLQEKENITANLIGDLNHRIKELTSQVENGTLLKNNLYILQAQKLQSEQELKSADIERTASLKMLGDLIEMNLDEKTFLALPNPVISSLDLNAENRPEYKFLDLQKTQLDYKKKIITTSGIPKISAFGQAGYGRPGLNILDNSFQPFYMVGLSLIWNPINWNSNNNDIQIYEINQRILDKQKETYDKNFRISLEKYKADILKYENLLKTDDEIISLRESITAITAAQLDNGAITSTIYATELNNKVQAQLMQRTHLIQLIQSKINFLTTKGSKIYE